MREPAPSCAHEAELGTWVKNLPPLRLRLLRSCVRMNYEDAQALLDGKVGVLTPERLRAWNPKGVTANEPGQKRRRVLIAHCAIFRAR